jgi:hypothetical protein
LAWVDLPESGLQENDPGHFSKSYQVHKFANRFNDSTAFNYLRYVSKDGNDSNSGYSWGDAKLTIKGAVKSLPIEGTTNCHHNGRVFIAPGNYVQSDPLEWSDSISYHGIHGDQASTAGVRVEGNGTDPVFTQLSFPTVADAQNYTNYSTTAVCHNPHQCTLENMGIRNLYTGVGVQMCNGGFNTLIRNVTFARCSWGLKTVGAMGGTSSGGNTCDLTLNNVTVSKCVNGGFNYNLYGGSGRFSLFGCQADNYGEYFMLINHHKGAINQFDIHGVRLEATDANTGKNVIKYYTDTSEPRPALIQVNSLTTRHSPSSPTIDNGIFYEDSDTTSRQGAVWNLNNVARLDNGDAQTGGKLFYSNIPATPVQSAYADYASSIIVQQKTIKQEYGWNPVG